MTIRADSYSSVAEVVAFTRHLLGGQSTYNSTTLPTLTEVERFIDRASGALNLSLAEAGFTVPMTHSTGALSLSDWVTQRASEYVEVTQRGVGYNDNEGNRSTYFRNMAKSAGGFVDQNVLGWKRLGASVAHKKSEGLSFTGLDAQADRTDPDDTGLQQPSFVRGQFDNVEGG